MNATLTPRQFVNRHNIRIACEWTDHNPNMDDSASMNHWRCTLKRERKQMTITFSMGYAHTGEPQADDVLECLAMDAAGYENARDFEDWCSEYGYNTDSRSAERTYKAIGKQAASLKRLLGDSLYDVALWQMQA